MKPGLHKAADVSCHAMKIIFVLTFTLISGYNSIANVDCIWVTTNSGVTIHYIAPCDFKKESLNNFLKQTINILNRQDTSLRILVLVNTGRLSFSGTEYANFLSMGYDTLRQIDDSYIFDSYWPKSNQVKDIKDTKSYPIDINSTNFKDTYDMGIKIIYDKDYRLGTPDWDEISKLIIYAAKNSYEVSRSQTRDTVRYNTNGWYVSLLTLDTISINKILGRNLSNQVIEPEKGKSRSKYYFIIGGLCVVIILTFLIAKMKHGS